MGKLKEGIEIRLPCAATKLYEFNVLLGEEGVKHLLQQLGLSSLEELLKINQMAKLSSAQFP